MNYKSFVSNLIFWFGKTQSRERKLIKKVTSYNMKVMKLFKKDFYKNFNNENIDETIDIYKKWFYWLNLSNLI